MNMIIFCILLKGYFNKLQNNLRNGFLQIL